MAWWRWMTIVIVVVHHGVHADVGLAGHGCQLLQLIAEISHCTQHNLESLTSVTVWQCTVPVNQQKLHGLTHVLVIHDTNASAPHSRNAYRLRVIGAEIWTPFLSYCNNGAAYAGVSLAPGTAYKVELLHLYSNFTTDESSIMEKQNRMLVLDMAHGGGDGGVRGGCRGVIPDDNAGQCPVCDFGENGQARSMHGRWVAADAQLVQETCIIDADDDDGTSFQENYDPKKCPNKKLAEYVKRVDTRQLQYQPWGCSLLDPLKVDYEACFATRRMCLVGDSHLRYLTNFLWGFQRGFVPDETNYGDWHSNDNEPPKTRFFWTPWGHFLMDDDPEPPSDDKDVHANAHVRIKDLDDCTDVVLSAGHWHLSFFMQRRQGGPFTQRQLYQLFTRARFFADVLRVNGKRVYWATIMAHPIRHARFRHPYKNPNGLQFASFHSLPYVQAANGLAARIFDGIPILDSHSIAEPLAELSLDGVHYIGTVGHAIGSTWVNMVCGATQQNGSAPGPAMQLHTSC